jgi:hypothetical protein
MAIRTYLTALSVVLMAPLARADPIFDFGQVFQISFERAPFTGTVNAVLELGTQEFCIVSGCNPDDAMKLTTSIVPAGTNGAEWLVFNFHTAIGNFISQGAVPGSDGANFPWQILEEGLKTLVPTDFLGDFRQFLDINGNPFTEVRSGGAPEPNESIFGAPIVESPIPGIPGNGELFSDLGEIETPETITELGSHVNDFGDVIRAEGQNDNETGFLEAFEFRPLPAAIPGTPETSTWVMALDSWDY